MDYHKWGDPDIEEWREDLNDRNEFGLGYNTSGYRHSWSCWPRQDCWYNDHHHQYNGCWPRYFCWPRQSCWPRGNCWPWKACWPRQGCCPR
ncbi:hypothetical protein [Pelosinus sp. UFO1]|uniref:hypothetical protein n=1 Tax=Pelosinus sp. UFO1 TaxID=484770 RepID=UPI0004D1D980|nr:hypothetical protein [Pelosinus sp. UFO1]AIF51827.1 hypothetical protein UFO1_2280 [Pelosinus sp. UFO1]